MAVLKAKGIQKGRYYYCISSGQWGYKNQGYQSIDSDIYPTYCHAYMVNIFFILLIKYLRHRHLQTGVAKSGNFLHAH